MLRNGIIFYIAAAFSLHAQTTAPLVITDDVDLFWTVFDKIEKYGKADSILLTEYYLKGSVGLRDFMKNESNNIESYFLRIKQAPQFYRSIRHSSLKIKLYKDSVRLGMNQLIKIYPDALLPKVFFIIGALNQGGTVSENGLLIGLEFFSYTDSVITRGLNSWTISHLKPMEDLPGIVMHELIHYQQDHGDNDTSETVLTQTLLEGSADFITYLIYGNSCGKFNNAHYEYGFKNEDSLWNEFSRDMHGYDVLKWMYQGNQSKIRPADIGYFIGFRICQSYYDHSIDKQKAVYDIIHIKDSKEFLIKSKYKQHFTK